MLADRTAISIAKSETGHFELEAELAKELDRRCEVLDDDANVVHPLKRHVPNISV